MDVTILQACRWHLSLIWFIHLKHQLQLRLARPRRRGGLGARVQRRRECENNSSRSEGRRLLTVPGERQQGCREVGHVRRPVRTPCVHWLRGCVSVWWRLCEYRTSKTTGVTLAIRDPAARLTLTQSPTGMALVHLNENGSLKGTCKA